MSKVLALYYSSYSHIETIAQAAAEGAREVGPRRGRHALRPLIVAEDSFLDRASGLWMHGALHGEVGGAFTSRNTAGRK